MDLRVVSLLLQGGNLDIEPVTIFFPPGINHVSVLDYSSINIHCTTVLMLEIMFYGRCIYLVD